MDSLMFGGTVEDTPDLPDSVLQNLLLKVSQRTGSQKMSQLITLQLNYEPSTCTTKVHSY